MGYEGSIPEDIGEQYILKNRLEGIKQSEQNKEENNAIYKSMKRQQENTDKKEKLEYNGLKNKSKTKTINTPVPRLFEILLRKTSVKFEYIKSIPL